MAKVVILGDTHLGARNDLVLFHKHFDRFYQWMLSIMSDMNITTIYQLGDLFDRRKYINFLTLSEARRYLFDRLHAQGIKLITLVGNHDIYWREKLSINSADMLLRDYDNITVCQRPQTFDIDGTTIDVIPWICADNHDEITAFISESKSDICIGHFEIQNFQMYRGVAGHGGLPADMFAKYERVLSGHYHTRSTRDNITYCGTPYEMTWQDQGDPKGFHVFDTVTRELTFFENPNKIFVRIDYDDTQDMTSIDAFDLRDCFVKVVVVNKTNLYQFDQYIQKLDTKGCFDIKIVEDMSEFDAGDVDEVVSLEDTMDVLSAYIDSIDTSADKDQIKVFMKSLYVEAINMEVV